MDVLFLRSWKRACRVTAIFLAVATSFAVVAAPPTKPAKRIDTVGEAEWIWSPAHTKDKAPAGICFFRKTFDLKGKIEQAQVQISCDDQFDLYVNGRLVGQGNDWKLLKKFDIQKYLQPGRNCIAVAGQNVEGGSAGLVARVIVRPVGGADVTFSTNAAWKTSLKEFPGWQAARFNDAQWTAATTYGEFGSTLPWSGQVAAVDGSGTGRFLLSSEFRVERVIGPEQTGSLIALCFNEWGEILASREGGGILLIRDDDDDGIPETVTSYCDKISNCQGLLPLNGMVYAVADGPKGGALYRLIDEQQDGKADKVEAVLEFEGGVSEHGVHAPVLGPDGSIYIMVGNHAKLPKGIDPASPYRNYYEGDLFDPKYEDPGGHAAGIKAPGGVVIRTDAEGSFVQLYAGGFRNAYDMAFSREGELFTYDSDMEWDLGLAWYRPTRVCQVTPGAEFGWRSGWSVWPDYFVDNLPPTAEFGRGSPTGVEFYNHHMFPARYHNAMFACDWSQGRIVAVRFKRKGASFEAESEIFLEGRPLNATDLAVGPDGWLYFATGGRGTEGGVYRVVWSGNVPPQNIGQDVAGALRQPQMQSAWSRQYIATVQEKLGDGWGDGLEQAARNAKLKPAERLRAIDLMQLVGPFPDENDLLALSKDKNVEVRAKATWLLGIHSSDLAGARLLDLVGDPEPLVRRQACEALVRGAYELPADRLTPLLRDADRRVRFAARKAIERLPAEGWRDAVLTADDPRVFAEGSVALLASHASEELARQILARAGKFLTPPLDSLSDDEFVDVLRAMELAIVLGKVPVGDLQSLRRQLADEYPAEKEYRMNRELVRLLAKLQEPSILPRLFAELEGQAPQAEKMHAALHAQYFTSGWKPGDKLKLLLFYEAAREFSGGHSFVGYIDNVTRDFCATLSEAERKQVLVQGAKMPSAALHVLSALESLPPELVPTLLKLDNDLLAVNTPAGKQLATGIVAVLGASKAPAAMVRLREQFEKNPARRVELAMGLAQMPEGENFPLLVRSLPLLDGVAAREVLTQLAKADEKPADAEAYRQTVLCGLRLGDDGAKLAIAVLEKWADQKLGKPKAKWQSTLAAWQNWFREQYPDSPPAVPPLESENAPWSYDELLGYLTGAEGTKGDPQKGALAFQKAQCLKCHRFGQQGEGAGPDLTTVSQRFHKKEILGSVLFPSHVISDQYAAKIVTTNAGKTYTGVMTAKGNDEFTVLQSNGQKVTLKSEDIAETELSKVSAMPEGLFNQLTLEEVADLFAFLESTPSTPSPTTVRNPKTAQKQKKSASKKK